MEKQRTNQGVFMSRFKQVWSSFRRKDQGFGMIETALFLPMLLMFVFAVIDFGNYMIVKNRVVNATNAIATAIENNPTMTTSAYNDLNSVLSKIIATNMGEMTNKDGTSIAIWSSKDVPENPRKTKIPGTEDKDANYQFTLRNLENPWLKDNDRSNDNNPYYVGVYVWRANPWLTPLPRLLKLNDVVDPTNIYGDAPYGRKGADAFIAVTLNNTTCPDGQVLQTVKGGTATCVARDANYSCPSGQFVTSSNNGIPTCSAPPTPIIFGGIFSKASAVAAGGYLLYPKFVQTEYCPNPNYFTGYCSCPFWAPEEVSFANVPTSNGFGGFGTGYTIYYCVKSRWP
jgi:Flp pilus assembly protein TadG